ncbi:plasmid replication protein RepC [Sulfitobacter sp. S190]|uniref:plasmid replication protein RepC n=1 Tax=Sulfitobacter sp. S190 TaxID=2867022 RepID=UPI0021A53AE3|nr:plasmid replication protein RepC [Sulfitobacter sp. S190]UWR24608.1 replication protein C [Sulfitobacter sp. S190]
MTQTGWRKPTPGLGVAEQLAQAGERKSIPKHEAFVAVKRVGAYIGLKASDLMLLDTLGAFTQPQDWEERRRPIVWASNAYLMEQTGFSLSALKRHARRLAEVGVIAFKDSPNGKRWGRRNPDGHIIEAYGFDLSPMAARVEEFTELYGHIQAERALCQRLKRQITVARRMIRARIEAALQADLSGAWARYLERFEGLLSRLPRANAASETLEQILSWFTELQQRVEQAYLKAVRADEVVENPATTEVQVTEKIQEMNPKEVISEPHILITKQLDPVISSCSEKEQAAGVAPERPTVVPVERPEQKEQGTEATKLARGVAVDVATVMQACPEFAFWARNMGGYLRDWGDLYRIAGDLKKIIGISDHAWLAAQEAMGKQMAAAAMALVFDKHAKGEIASAGGYLRGMTEKAGAGELHLERSFYGRLSGQAA